MPHTLLKQRDDGLAMERERFRETALVRLRQALKDHLPGQAVWVYGSILIAGRFRLESDIDIALEQQPISRSLYALQSLLTEATGHAVDICVLEETRFKEKILLLGQRWIESA
jgi:predicted nucleotidyltransferase